MASVGRNGTILTVCARTETTSFFYCNHMHIYELTCYKVKDASTNAACSICPRCKIRLFCRVLQACVRISPVVPLCELCKSFI